MHKHVLYLIAKPVLLMTGWSPLGTVTMEPGWPVKRRATVPVSLLGGEGETAGPVEPTKRRSVKRGSGAAVSGRTSQDSCACEACVSDLDH